MGNPLQHYLSGGRGSRSRHSLRRVAVPVPMEVQATDAIFVVMRRMRHPLVLLVVIFTIAVTGLTFMPGTDADGNPYRMTFFDAFYVMSYTATTIGYGETPYEFSYPQRLWVTLSIWMSVVGWAYTLGTLLQLFRERNFIQALNVQRFGRKVKAIREPFWILAGFGPTGRAVARALDAHGHAFVVVDSDAERIESLEVAPYAAEVPALDGDVSNPSFLGLAGLDHPQCAGVLALADDEANVAVIMAVNLLRPEVPVIARCDNRDFVSTMEDFEPEAVVNPFDRYGSYLLLALRNPATYQLVQWLTSAPGDPLPPRRTGLATGRWVVVGDGRFGREVAHDLRAGGLDVVLVNPDDGNPEVADAVGLVAGAENDVTNLGLAAHARLVRPDLFLALRQRSTLKAATLQAFDPDSLFVPSDLTAREMVARVVTPSYWSFIDDLLQRDDEWSEPVLELMIERLGEEAPATDKLVLDKEQAPAVVRWLDNGGTLTLGQLISHPNDHETRLQTVAMMLQRDGETIVIPDEETPLEVGDELVLAGTDRDLDVLTSALFQDSVLCYLTTGETVPETWIWRQLTRRGRRAG